ncbi:hypothetical protein HNP33_002568 [Comamonas odontotermitis]|uniref:Nicotinamide riboside transporter PnuC n=1 Tax=Comamonas odontotermitis TaxID=379895 RepID=A0ABR6RH45_9BURK|nr:hypothetical protein [Comamonas odontotermitis]MBB6578486.1 hypothetical protein [Comamonas odontotermitis]
MQIDQIAIAVLGAAAAWLSQARSEAFRRWACIFGMLGQPFWFYASWNAEQWGIFVVSVLYALAWMKGLWNHWIRPTPSDMAAEKIGTIQFVPEAKK